MSETLTMRFTEKQLWFITEQLWAASTNNYEDEPVEAAIAKRFSDAHAKLYRRRKARAALVGEK